MSENTTRRRMSSLLESRRGRINWVRAFAFAALLLTLCVGLGLRQRGVAATHKEQVLDCHYAGNGAHTHDASCYDADGRLVCKLAERELHSHDDSCYTETRELVCGLEESDGHQHTDACYDEEGNLVCGLEESEGHHHTEDCYQVTRELTCGEEEVTESHEHGPGCFKTIEVQDADVDTDAEATDDTLIPAAVAANGEQIFTGPLTKVNADGTEEVLMVVSVKAPAGAFPTGTSMKLSEVKPEQVDQVQKAVNDAAKKANEEISHLTWSEGVDIAFVDAEGNEVKPAEKIEVKISKDRIRDIEEPILARLLDSEAKATYHKTDDAEVLDKVVLANQSDNDTSTGNENSLKFETKLPTIYVLAEAAYKEGHVAKPLKTESAVAAGEQTFTATAGGVTVTAVAPAGTLPEGTDMVVTAVVDTTEVKGQVEEAVASDETHVKDLAVVEVGFVDGEGSEVKPEGQMSVSLESDIVADAEATALVRVGEESEVVAEGTEPGKTALSFDGDAAGTYALVGTETITTQVITASGDTYQISVTYGPEAGIPAGAELAAREILSETDEYRDYCAQAAEALGSEDVSFARFFDVTIVTDRQKIEPAAPVEVEIRNTASDRPSDATGLQVVHFADAGTEVIEPTVEDDATATTITYMQDSFSVIGTVSTVKQNGFPTSNGQHVIVLQDGEDYYALKKDGTLTKVRYFNDTVSFIGPGTTTTDYINDYLWYVQCANAANSQGTIRDSYDGDTYLDPLDESCLSNSRRNLRINADNKIYCNGQLPGTTGYQQISLSAEGGQLQRVLLADEGASSVLFANASTFEANSNETDLFTQEEVESIIANWQNQMTQEMSVDKTAEVHDYDNRIYRVDVAASSADYEISPSIALEFVVDASRSMFFPTSITEVDTFSGGNAAGVRNWINAHGNHDQVYFVIQNKNGAATQYAIFWDPTGYWDDRVWHDGRWRVVDASNYNPPDDTANGGSESSRYEGTALSDWNQGSLDDGKIYTTEITGTSYGTYGTRKTWVSRIEYLKQCVRVAAQVVYAVDENAQIGLIGFNKDVTNYGTYGKADQATLLAQVDNISLAGGTNHEGGLVEAIKKYDKTRDPAYYAEHYANRKHVVVLVTDGAPNYAYGKQKDGTDTSTLDNDVRPVQNAHTVTWDSIGKTADKLRGMKDDFGNNTELYTMGLSLKNVGTNQEGLFGIATNSSYCYAAEDAAQIINAVTKMVQGVFVQANLIGDVKDVVDPAFYPVDRATGKALAEGDWINLDGEKVAAGADDAVGQVSKDPSTGNWVVEWKDQSIDWPTRDESGHVEAPGWHGTVFVKAKEDFLGGNGISTNASGSQIVASKYRIEGKDGTFDLPEGNQNTSILDTPYVNVDELGLTKNDTEWTVYLGTEVDPLTEVKELWNKIKVIEVVTKTGDDHRVAADGNLKYGYSSSTANTADTVPVAGDEEFLLSSLVTLTDDDWSSLLEGNLVTINYDAYTHTGVGSITVLLTQGVTSGEKNLLDSPHATEVVGQAVEKYTLSVRYTPAGASIANWHTGSYGSEKPGERAGRVNSVNTHTINVYVKGLQITKVDQGDEVLLGAKFGLFRTPRDGETDEDKLREIDGKQYYQVTELDTSASGVASLAQLEQLREDEQYFLVETEVPTGYIAIGPIPVTLTFTDVFTPKPGTTTQSTKPDSGIYDWQQKAVLRLDAEGGVKRTNADNTQDLTHSGIEATVENDTVYYRITNTSGAELPKAGGSGLVDLYATGIAMMAGAATYLFFRRKGERS